MNLTFDQPTLAFPQALTERHRPKNLCDFAGLAKPKAILEKLAAHPFPSAWLFLGPSGTGKTTMALALAELMPAELHHVPSQECNVDTVREVCRVCQYEPGFLAERRYARMHLVLVDEADAMSNAAQMAFLSKLDSTAKPPKTVFIFTANATDRLQDRFLSRVQTLGFHGPNGELLPYLERVWKLEAPGVPVPDLSDLAASGNVRDALMKLELELMAV